MEERRLNSEEIACVRQLFDDFLASAVAGEKPDPAVYVKQCPGETGRRLFINLAFATAEFSKAIAGGPDGGGDDPDKMAYVRPVVDVEIGEPPSLRLTG